jgi:flagellar basal body-associated protein FliL
MKTLVKPKEQNQTPDPGKKESSNNAWIWIAVLLIMAITAAFIFNYIKKQNEKEASAL